MRWNPLIFRLCASVAVTALLAESALPVSAWAQQGIPQAAQPAAPPAAPPLPVAGGDGSAPAAQNQADPPGRVGRVAGIQGTASFHDQGDTQWSALSTNFPVSSGNAFWTQPNSSANLEVNDSLIAMAGSTEFDVHALDQNGLQGVAAQGEIYLDLRNLAPDETWEVQTPRGLVKFAGSGRYGVVVGSTTDPTLVTVIAGSASVQGANFNLTVQPNQAAKLTGTDPFEGEIVPAARDAFLSAMLQKDGPPAVSHVPSQVAATVSAMPGGYDLESTGSWSDAPDYGQVWYPPVDPGWVPYRHGHWAYVAPWGWTWIDDAPWGFAPFHYGRWVEIGGRWGWTPGEVEVSQPPVYAPALVAFIGLGAGVAIGAALASGNIGWVPLGPREPYRPWYHASDRYMQRVNHGHNVTNVTNIQVNNFVNRRGATVMPATAMASSRPVAGAGRPMTAEQFSSAHAVFGQQPVRPTAATVGVTPAVARRLNIAPGAGGRPMAPGPAIHPARAGGPAMAGGPAAGRHGGAPGPAIRTEGPAAAVARPVLPGAGAGAVAGRPGVPEAARPGVPEAARPGLPGAVHGTAVEPHVNGPAALPHVNGAPVEPHGVAPGVEPHVGGPAAVPHVGAPRFEPRGGGPAAEHRVGAPSVVPHVNAPAAVPHVAAPASVPHVAAAPGAPRFAAPPPHVVAPHVVAPHVVAPHVVAPHAAAPPPRMAAPVMRAPAPHFSAPSPRPAPAPHPAPSPQRRPGER